MITVRPLSADSTRQKYGGGVVLYFREQETANEIDFLLTCYPMSKEEEGEGADEVLLYGNFSLENLTEG